MAKSLAPNANAMNDENAELRTAIRECIVEVENANKRMEERQVRINKLKAETRVMLNELNSFHYVA